VSATTAVTIWCDAFGCTEWGQGAEGNTVAEARRQLARWTTTGSRDFCPDCSAERTK
jgi:hypothetical protein